MSHKQQIAWQLQQAERPLLICHYSPDGDALGSLLGLGLALQRKGKQPHMVCEDPPPPTYDFLPGADQIHLQPNGEYDLVVSLDCSDTRRMGAPYRKLVEQQPALPLLNIDHHTTNLNFGTLNWIDDQAVATAEMILELIQTMALTLDTDIATCLLTGIVTDTRGFRTSNVSPRVMNAAIHLMEAGADLARINHLVFSRRPLSAVRLWKLALDNFQQDGRIIWSVISREMQTQSQSERDGDAGLVSFLGDVNEADIAVVFTERQNGEIDVGIRAHSGWNVAQVALALGGGGHPQAAGCTLQTSLEEAIRVVLPALQAAWREQADR
ncbi:MAG: DHH family phosphoesterase [Chloroflexota bacterium]